MRLTMLDAYITHNASWHHWRPFIRSHSASSGATKDFILLFFSTRAEELLSTCKHTCTGWFVLVSATQLKPDEGTPELPEGRVRVRLQTDGSLHDVTEYEIEKVHQCFSLNVTFISVVSSEDWPCLLPPPPPPPQCNPSELDLCEDLSDLQSVNECGVLHTLTSRAKASMPLTHAGPNLVNFWPPIQANSKVMTKIHIQNCIWKKPVFNFLCLLHPLFFFFFFFFFFSSDSQVSARGVGVGRSSCSGGSGQTGLRVHGRVQERPQRLCCWTQRHRQDDGVPGLHARPPQTSRNHRREDERWVQRLHRSNMSALSADGWPVCSVPLPPSVERVQAMFTVLKSFGCVSSQHSDASSRFAMVFSLDFNHAGQAAAGHLQAGNTHGTESTHTHKDTILTTSSSSTRRWCWTSGRSVTRLQERATSWSSLRCWRESARRWGNLQKSDGASSSCLILQKYDRASRRIYISKKCVELEASGETSAAP